MKRFGMLLVAWAVFGVAARSSAQLITQTIPLRQGWNAIFLEVQPQPSDCDSVFSGTAVESVWAWNKRFSSVQYIQDPNTLLPGQPDWLTYLRPADPGRAVVNLFTLQGGKPYLIKTTSATTLNIHGRPVVRSVNWLGDSFNLAGFYVSSSGPPTFQSFFAPSVAHAGQPMYRLSAAGTWQAVISPSSTTLARGESYWIRSATYSQYPGFLHVSFEQGAGLDFGRVLTEETLTIRNTSSNNTSFTLTRLASAAPPSTNYPALAGAVPLSYWRMNLASSQVGWVVLPASLTSPVVPPGGEWSVRLAVRRAEMPAFALPSGYHDALFQTVLRLTDTLGSEVHIPVSAKGLQRYGDEMLQARGVMAEGGSLAASQPVPPDPRAGLWIGSVALSSVSQAAVSEVATPAASEFQFRVILHVDAAGETRLLQKIILAWTNGLVATNAQGMRETLTPGRFALLTDESLIARFSGSALRDGNVTGQRFASAAFSFRDPILASRNGSFGASNTVLSCTVPLGFDDPLNPFKHRYHPDHNNLDNRYENAEQESPDVVRQIALRFTGEDPDNVTLPGWGDNQLGGVYSELISGLHKSRVYVQGSFRLYRASTVATLNDL
jgi:hypothetical protein